jgi:restriction system protein
MPPTPPIIKQVDYFDPAVYELIRKNPQLLNTLDWRIFEEMLADILKTFGYSIELTKRTKDGGIDVIAIKADNDFGSHKYILQAKRYSKAIQVSPIRELLFLHSEQRASKCCLATTSTFTTGAKELGEQYRWTLELKDKQGILEWIERADAIKSQHASRDIFKM